MRDLKIFVPTEAGQQWTFDLDIVDGCPVFVDYERNTQDQRAAISTYIVRGSIPGKQDQGVNWAQLYTQDTTLLNIDNEIKQSIQNNAGIPGAPTQSYIPMYTSDEKGIHVGIYQS